MTKLLKDYFFAIVGAAILALVLRVFVLEAFRIPSDLMSPALIPGDYIFVNKLTFGGKFGLSEKKPVRGQVVLFSFPSDLTKDYIKRVIGIGGDKVLIRDGQVFVNGKSISKRMDSDLYEEQFDNQKYYVSWKDTPIESRKMLEVTVPNDQMFVLGDNRTKSQDSRSWGFLPNSYLKGQASVIWFSSSEVDGVRWQRVMSRVR